jgi:glycosyltransferase involved in cell wall biosynthesis
MARLTARPMIKPYLPPTRLDSVSIILPVINETVSLRKTVETILHDVKRELIREFIIVVCKRTTPEAMTVITQLQNEFRELVVVLQQKLPFLGGALRDAFDVARGSHVIIMGSDLETNPDDVHVLIEEQQKAPASIVTTSRWIRGGEFNGYSPIKLLCNWIFQRFFSLLYLTPLTDMTFGFRIMPTGLAQAIRWEEVRHPFNLENVIKPLRLGIPVSEIPTIWNPRIEGESQNPFFRNFEYFRIGFKARFARKNSFWRT